ncbi:MAG TPA: S8 family serine peptidase [Polyangia bacterium]|nr:S8 family serine peptidase [Polyangia bacterium]
MSALVLCACDGAVTGSAGTELPSQDLPAAPAASSKIDPRVGLDRHGAGSREVIVLLDEQSLRATFPSPVVADDPGRIEAVAAGLDLAKERLLGRMSKHRLVALDRYSHLPALHLVVDSDAALGELADDPAVLRIVPNDVVELAEMVPSNLALIKQPQVTAAGKLGAGATVAVLDTGTDYKRAPFNCAAPGEPGCKIVYAGDFAPEDNAPDANGHGTNVSGIVLAVAPGAQIAALDVFNGDSGWTSDILKAINWTIQNKAKYNIVAINLSLGGGSFQSVCATDPLAIAVDSARTAGILSAVASGNGGLTNAVSSPACGASAISVGAVHAANVGGLRWPVCADPVTAADKVACFSNSIPFLTILAPGVMINAAGVTMTGTSQAAPHVAGAIAVLRSAFPAESPDAIVKRLTSTGVPVTDPRNNVVTPRLDLLAALGAPADRPTAPGPTGKLVLNGGTRFTKSTKITASVATTGGTATQVCLSASASCTVWMTWAPTVSWTLPTGDGTKLVNAWWKDARGNVSAVPATATIVLDTTAPVGGTLSVKLGGGQGTFSWAGVTDAGAGIAGYKLVVAETAIAAGCAGKAAYEGKNTMAVVKGLVAKKTYYVRMCSTDNLGNGSAGFGGPFVMPSR